MPITPVHAYNANMFPIFYCLKSTPFESANIYSSYKPLIMVLPQLPKGYRSRNYTATKWLYYINIYNNKAQ